MASNTAAHVAAQALADLLLQRRGIRIQRQAAIQRRRARPRRRCGRARESAPQRACRRTAGRSRGGCARRRSRSSRAGPSPGSPCPPRRGRHRRAQAPPCRACAAPCRARFRASRPRSPCASAAICASSHAPRPASSWRSSHSRSSFLAVSLMAPPSGLIFYAACIPTLVILAVGLSPALVGEHTPNLQAPRDARRPAAAAHRDAGRDLHGAVHAASRASRRAATASWRTAGISGICRKSGCGGSRTGWSRARRSGTRRKARDASFTCAKMFWWYNMYSSADWSATPRPMYPADGRKIPDHYAHPASSCTTSSTRSSGRSRCSSSGARSPTSLPASGSPGRPCT